MTTATTSVGVLGAGTMGSGIAQLAAEQGHRVLLFDNNSAIRANAKGKISEVLKKQVNKKRLEQSEANAILSRIDIIESKEELAPCDLIIEAVVEDLEVKRCLLSSLEDIVNKSCVLATNTSSLPITAIAGACKAPERVIGIHFFNPAPLMPLVEIIPALQTSPELMKKCRSLVDSWGKTTVVAKDTPGFIVNRIARPFYGEALRILEEGVADVATIDWAMKDIGGFRMGPFELMDFIGVDVNYAVSESVFKAFYYDPRYRPSLIQKRMLEARQLGRKTGIGFYDYSQDLPSANEDRELGETILGRILCMLINEAVDAVFLNIATVEDIDLAVTKGVNYPKGLLAWADEIELGNGASAVGRTPP